MSLGSERESESVTNMGRVIIDEAAGMAEGLAKTAGETLVKYGDANLAGIVLGINSIGGMMRTVRKATEAFAEIVKA